tara:strand:- start:212 stop:712 length:501 start_codon:yes stop_codon:yes gene_type:complete
MPLLGREKVQYELEVGILKRVNNNVKGVYLSGLGNIIAGTPVGLTQGEIPIKSISTSGLTRNNWFLSVGASSGDTTTSKSSAGANSLRQLAKLPSVVLGKRIFYTNNRPNITTLEYGDFPSPVKKGSRLRGKNKFQILSVNGFSKQAPSGWVRTTLIAMGNKIRSL